ncbi:hypothetical protein [Dyella sp.]|uniref:hypothetical protein n=1 Tax=Dyella sp. TaxID=1869338 RepID=UPI003F7EBAF5
MVAMKSNLGMLRSCDYARSSMAVIPAKAGIHIDFLHQSKMGSRFRGNDGHEGWLQRTARSAA